MTNKTHKPTKVPLAQVQLNKALQMRTATVDDHIDGLKEAITTGIELPPVDLYGPDDEGSYYVGDGNHRLIAHILLKKTHILAIVHEGGLAEARRHAYGANSEHLGLRRTNADKRRAVLMALAWEKGASHREVADLCKVSHQCVNKIKKELEAEKKAKESGDPADTSAAAAKLDLYALLNRDFTPVAKSAQHLLNQPYWAEPSIPMGDKLEGVRVVIRNLKDVLDQAKQREAELLRIGAELDAAKDKEVAS